MDKEDNPAEIVDKFRLIVENIVTPVFITQRGRYIYVNPAFEKLTGYPEVELYKMESYLDIVDPEYLQQQLKMHLQDKLLHEQCFNEEIKIKTRDGETRWAALTGTEIGYEGGAAILGSGQDITIRKQFEGSLQNTEEKYRSIFENISDGVYQIDPQGFFISINPAFARIFGFTSVEEMLDSIHDVQNQLYVNPADRTLLLKCLTEHDHHKFETEMYRRDGSKMWLSFTVRAIRNGEGDLLYIEGICRDTTDRKRSEELALAAQHQMEQVIELLPDATLVIDQLGKVIFWNKAMEEMTGISKEQMIGSGNHEYSILFYGERRPILIDMALMSSIQLDDIKGKYDFIHQKGDTLFGEIYVPQFNQGKGAYLWGSASKLVDEKGNIVGAIQSIRDISDRKAAERARDEAAAIQKMTLLSIGDGIISTDHLGRISHYNLAAEQITGWSKEEAFGKPLEEIFNIHYEVNQDECIEPFKSVMENGKTIENVNNTFLISKESHKIPIEHTAAPIHNEDGTVVGVVLVFKDITNKKQRQDRIEYLSFHDHLTGLYNRRFVEEEMARLDLKENLPFSLIMADVNGLKLTNDAFGHAVGDELIVKAAEVMKRECRNSDILARTGGDEFIFLLPQTSNDEAKQIVNRLYAHLAEEKTKSINLSVAFGWATKEDISENISTVYKRAEDYMYKRKLSQSPITESNTIKLVMKNLYEKSKSEEQHSIRVSKLCAAIGREMDFDAEELDELCAGGLLHDIGKIALSESILSKTGRLNDSEWFEMKRHPETGHRILSSLNEFSKLADDVLAHHERWDGEGYPNGIKSTDIPLKARILAVADAYDAMTSDRPFRPALDEETVVAEIKNNAGKQFDPVIAKTFVEKVLGVKW